MKIYDALPENCTVCLYFNFRLEEKQHCRSQNVNLFHIDLSLILGKDSNILNLYLEDTMKYISTRGNVSEIGFIDTVLMGLANDGGLINPGKDPTNS